VRTSFPVMWLLSLPLGIVWFVWFLISLLVSLLMVMVKQMFACCSSGPDAPDKGESPLLGSGHAPVPRYHAWTGDVIHYIQYQAKSWLAMDVICKTLGSKVFTYNMGDPTVACLDVSSSESILCDIDTSKNKHNISLIFNKDYYGGQGPNFIENGESAKRTRDFFLAVLPETPEDALFQAGIARMKKDLTSFIAGAGESSSFGEVQKFIDDLIVTSISTMFFGETLDMQLFHQMWPLPTVSPKSPSFPPNCLFPLHWRGKEASNKLYEAMKSLPNFAQIEKMAQAHQITVEQALGNITCGISFNAAGFAGPMANAFLILDQLPLKGQELLSDQVLLESLAWELLRHNGPGLSYETTEETTVTSSQGVTHRVKKGTELYTQLGFVQRDSTVWKDADTFKVDRFKPLPPRDLRRAQGSTEPLPSVGFGCPLGFIDDERQRKSSHQCIFMQLAQPYMVEYLKLLVSNFEWKVKDFEMKQGKSAMDFDYSASQMTGGQGAAFLPKAAVKEAKISWSRK